MGSSGALFVLILSQLWWAMESDALARGAALRQAKGCHASDDGRRLIEAAQMAQADVIVTGDPDLLTLSRINEIRILILREFLEALQHGT